MCNNGHLVIFNNNNNRFKVNDTFEKNHDQFLNKKLKKSPYYLWLEKVIFFQEIRFFTFTHIHKPKNNTILPSRLQILVTNANIFKYKLGRSRNSLKRVKQDTKICLSIKFIDLSHHSFPIFAPENFKLVPPTKTPPQVLLKR